MKISHLLFCVKYYSSLVFYYHFFFFCIYIAMYSYTLYLIVYNSTLKKKRNTQLIRECFKNLWNFLVVLYGSVVPFIARVYAMKNVCVSYMFHIREDKLESFASFPLFPYHHDFVYVNVHTQLIHRKILPSIDLFFFCISNHSFFFFFFLHIKHLSFSPFTPT